MKSQQDAALNLQLVALGACLASRPTLSVARPQDFTDGTISRLVATLQAAVVAQTPGDQVGELRTFLRELCNCETLPNMTAIASIFEQLHLDAAHREAVKIATEMANGGRMASKRQYIETLQKRVNGIEFKPASDPVKP